MGGFCNDHLLQLSDQDWPTVKVCFKGIAQMPLKHWEAWGINHLPSKPVTVFDHPLNNEMFLIVTYECPLMQF